MIVKITGLGTAPPHNNPKQPINGEAVGMRLKNSFSCILGLLALAGCATPPQNPAERAAFEQTNDPLEPLNREVYGFNQFLDKYLFEPAADTYSAVIPPEIRQMIRNVLNNMDEPLVFADNVLQGEFGRSGTTAMRFGFNTIFGLGGMFDFCGNFGILKENGDFGQTLYSWGVDDGPYLVLPVLGPSNPRDSIGLAVDSYMDPLRYNIGHTSPNGSSLAVRNSARSGADGLDKRAAAMDDINEIQKNSIDQYAQLRSLYRQNRAKELRHGEPAPEPVSAANDLYADPAKK